MTNWNSFQTTRKGKMSPTKIINLFNFIIMKEATMREVTWKFPVPDTISSFSFPFKSLS